MKLFASDFDGTFYLGSNPSNFDENIKKVKEFQKEHKFAFVTGRSPQSIQNMIQSKDIVPDYIAGYNGGIILDSNNQVLYQDLPKVNINQLNQLLKEEKVNFLTCMSEKLVYRKHYSLSIKGYFISNIFLMQSKLKTAKNYEEMDESKIFMYTVSCKNEKQAQKVCKKINEMNMECSAYANKTFIDITGKHSSKASAVEIIEKQIQADEVYVIGDSYNDLPMIEKYHGFAMNQANDTIKEKASCCFASVKEAIESIM